jgi:hypothetical protein
MEELNWIGENMADLEEPIKSEPIEDKAAQEFPEPEADLSKEPMPTLAGDYLPLKDFYGIKDLDRGTQDKLQTVWEHFAQDAKTPSTVLNRIRLEHHNLAQPNIGDTRLNQMYGYVRILQDIKESEQLKRAYKK